MTHAALTSVLLMIHVALTKVLATFPVGNLAHFRTSPFPVCLETATGVGKGEYDLSHWNVF